MVKRNALLDAFEKEQIRQNKADYRENLKIFEALYREALALGVLPPEDSLEGIEVKIRLAKALHVRMPSGEPGCSMRLACGT